MLICTPSNKHEDKPKLLSSTRRRCVVGRLFPDSPVPSCAGCQRQAPSHQHTTRCDRGEPCPAVTLGLRLDPLGPRLHSTGRLGKSEPRTQIQHPTHSRLIRVSVRVSSHESQYILGHLAYSLHPAYIYLYTIQI